MQSPPNLDDGTKFAACSIKQAFVRQVILGLRALESSLPPWCLLALVWPVAALLTTWELVLLGPTVRDFDRLPPSLRPAGSRLGWIWRLWCQRINFRLTKLLILWPDRLETDRWRPRFRSTGFEQLERLVAEGRPVVLTLMHFGPHALLRYWLRARGVAVGALVGKQLALRPVYRDYLDGLSDGASGLGNTPHLFDLGQLRQAVRFLQSQGLLMVALDAAQGRDVWVEGDDYALRLRTGAIRLATAANAILVPCFAFSHRAFGMTLHLGLPVSAEGNTQEICANLMHQFIPVLRAHPEHCEGQLLKSFRASSQDLEPVYAGASQTSP